MIYRSGAFEVDAQRCELRRDGARLNVQRKVLDTIVFLVERRERVVTRAELTRHLWSDVIVSEGSIGTLIKDARQLLGDDGGAQRVILTVRGRGFRWVAPTEVLPTEDATSVPHAVPQVSASAPPPWSIVGRRGEIDAFDQLLEEVVAQRLPGALLVVGEAGIGKTRLADAFVGRARARDFSVAVVSCDEIEGAGAERPWKQLLRTLAPGEALDWIESRQDPHRLEETRFRLFEDVAAFVRRATDGRRWLFLLDDLHAASPFTLALTAFVARELGEGSILAGTWREPELAASDPRQRWLLSLRRLPRARTLVLSGLSREESRELVVRLAPEEASSADRFHAESKGNPFFLEELVRATSAGANAGTSPALDAMIGQRLAQLESLDPIARRLLEAAAIVGQEPSRRLAEAAAGFSAAECLDAWDRIEELGFLRVTSAARGDEEERWVFSHGLVRASIEASMPRASRKALHARIAEAIEREAPLSRAEWRSAFAHHCRKAVPVLSAERARGASVEAARESARKLAFEDAEHHLAGAIALLEDDVPERGRLYRELGEVQLAAGAYAAGRESFLEAVRLARSSGQDDLLAAAALGVGQPLEHILQPTSDTVLVECLRAALAGKVDDPATRVRLKARLAIALHTAVRDPEGVAIGDEARSLARETGDADLIAYAELARYWGSWGGDRLEETLACTRAMAAHGERGQTGHLAAFYALVHGAMLVGFGRIEEARAQLRVQAEHAQRTRRPHARAFVCMFEAMIALLEWEPETAERRMGEWFSLSTQLGDPVLANVLFLVQLWPLRRQMGRSAELVPILRQALAGWPSIGMRSMLAASLLDIGEREEARWIYDAACAEIATLREDRASYYLVLQSLPDVTFAFGDERAAREQLAIFERATGEHVVHPPGYQGPLARHLAVLAATAGDRARAGDLLDRAASHAEAIGARWWHTRIGDDRVRLGISAKR